MKSNSLDDLARLAVFDARSELLTIQVRVRRALQASDATMTEADVRAFAKEITSLYRSCEILDFDVRTSLQRIINGSPTHISEVVAETIQPQKDVA